jgi:aryl-alcohol dehydrogenase-like predicted oxidoreductase
MAIPTHVFGRTGHTSSRTLFGGASLGSVSQEVADRTLEVLLSYGVNHIDVAASYGEAEVRIKPWLREHRSRFFVATKTGKRTASEAREELKRSLDRMGVDQIDLWQLHNLADPSEWETAFGSGGAIETAVQAREEGLVRFIGVTGHGMQIPATHRRSIERFDFDSVLLPYNYVVTRDPRYAENFEALVQSCQEANRAVQTIKSIAYRPWPTEQRARSTWYQPLEDQGDIDLAVWWVLSRPGIFLNTVGDVDLLPRVLDAASRFDRAVGDEEMAALVERVKPEPIFA